MLSEVSIPLQCRRRLTKRPPIETTNPKNPKPATLLTKIALSCLGMQSTCKSPLAVLLDEYFGTQVMCENIYLVALMCEIAFSIAKRFDTFALVTSLFRPTFQLAISRAFKIRLQLLSTTRRFLVPPLGLKPTPPPELVPPLSPVGNPSPTRIPGRRLPPVV